MKTESIKKYFPDSELTHFYSGLAQLDEYYRAFGDKLGAQKTFFCRLLLGTGMRIHEACSLRLEYIDPDLGLIWVEVTKGNNPRMVELMPELAPHVKAYVSQFLAGKKSGWLFPAKGHRGSSGDLWRNSPIDVRTGRNWWYAVLKLVGLPSCRPHTARSNYCCWEMERLQRGDLQAQVGHRTYRTTDEYYFRSQPGRRYKKDEPKWRAAALLGLPQQPQKERLRRIK